MKRGFPLQFKIRRMLKESPLFYRLLPSYVPWEPVGFSFVVTTFCNLKCKMCARTINGIKPTHMKKEVFLKASKYFKNKEVSFCGLGETLLHPKIFDFLKIATSKNAKISFTTNAMLLKEDTSKKLLRYNVDSMFISIDGVDGTYNKIRSGGDFNTVIENIKKLSELKKERGVNKPLLYISFVGMKSNIEDFPKLIEILGPHIDYIEILHPIVYTKKLLNQHLNKSIKLAKKVYRESERLASKYNINLGLRPLQPHPRGCLEPWTKPHLGIDGKVYPCTLIGGNDGVKFLKEYYEDFTTTLNLDDFVLGNIMEQDFYEIWNNEKYKKLRKALKRIFLENMKRKWTNKSYVKMLKKVGPSIFFCDFCTYRWDCSC